MKKINLFILAVVCTFAFACGNSTPEENAEDTMTTDDVENALEEAGEDIEKQADEAIEGMEEAGEDIKEGAEDLKDDVEGAVEGHEGHDH